METKTNNIVGKIKRAKFMGAWLRLEVETPFKKVDGELIHIWLLRSS